MLLPICQTWTPSLQQSSFFVTVNIKAVDAHCAGPMTCFYIKLLTHSLPVTHQAQSTLFHAEANVLGSARTLQRCCIFQTKPSHQRFRGFPKSINTETLKTLHLDPLPSFPPQNFLWILYSRLWRQKITQYKSRMMLKYTSMDRHQLSHYLTNQAVERTEHISFYTTTIHSRGYMPASSAQSVHRQDR